jgi:hypothetical protein
MSMSGKFPLTFQQEWLWDAVRANESWQCTATRAFRVSGSLNIPLLQQCLQEVCRRHGALRTRIVGADGGVWQESQDREECALNCITIAGTSKEQVAANARRCFEDIGDRKINLAVEPFWNATLLELSEHEHWLVLAMNRLIGDCVEIERIYREIKPLYEELSHGRSSALQPPKQYSSYTVWQQQTAAEWLRRHEPYWNWQLNGAIPVRWPIDTDLTVATPGILGKAQCSFGKACSAGLMDLARRVRTLPAVPMMAIYVAVLWRWCLQEDFVLPLNTAGRPSEYKSALGLFSYALHLRIHITGDETFTDLVSRVGNEFFSGMLHQDFGRIARQRPELLSGTLFQWVTWHPEESPEELVQIREFGEGMTVVPPGMTALEVTVFDTETGLHAFGSYRADRFAAKTMERFMADLRGAAEVFAHNPDARIAAIAEVEADVHTPAQRRASGVATGA